MSEETKTPANIHEAIAAVMAEVGYVQKERTRGLNYSFAGEAALIAALRPAMVKYGIYCYVLAHEDVAREGYETSRGTAMTSTTTRMTARFVHAPSETYIDVQSLGEGADAGDKSGNKAATGAYKYALRQTFLIETGDDPDTQSSDEQQRKAGTTRKKSSGNGNHTDHTQQALVAWASQEFGLDGKGVGSALKSAGITQFDPDNWEQMQAAIQVHASSETPGD